jgi:hypothetical protein
MTRAHRRVPVVHAARRPGSLLEPQPITIVTNQKASGSFWRRFIHAEHAGKIEARYARSDASWRLWNGGVPVFRLSRPHPARGGRPSGRSRKGTLTEGFWSPAANNPDTDRIQSGLGTQITTLPDLGLAVTALSAGQVLLDGISAAGSTDPNAINDALGRTDKTYPVGPVKFSEEHTSVTPHFILQWHDGNAVQVVPPTSTPIQSPSAGLS